MLGEIDRLLEKNQRLWIKGLSNDNHDHTDNLCSSRVSESLQYII